MAIKFSNSRAQRWVDAAHEDGGFRGALAEAGAALFECYARADAANRDALLALLAEEAARYAEEVQGWSDGSVTDLRHVLVYRQPAGEA